MGGLPARKHQRAQMFGRGDLALRRSKFDGIQRFVLPCDFNACQIAQLTDCLISHLLPYRTTTFESFIHDPCSYKQIYGQ